jgi:hypothetical protein
MLSGIADDQYPVLGVLSEIPGDQTGDTEGFQMLRRQIDKEKPFLPRAELGEFITHVFDVRLIAKLFIMFLAEGLSDEAEKVFSQRNTESGLQAFPLRVVVTC